MTGEISATMEEYLETIYRLEEKHGVATTSKMAEYLGVVPGTITNTIEHLEEKGLVEHAPYKGAKLTRRGRELALDAIRRHRIAERFLTDILHISWEKAHEHACELEHCLKGEVLEKLEEVLGNPKTCPHGNPIPLKSGKVADEPTTPLADAAVGKYYTVVRITEEGVRTTEEGREKLLYLHKLGLLPGTKLRIQEKAPFDGPITVRIHEESRALSRSLASAIHVRPLERPSSRR